MGWKTFMYMYADDCTWDLLFTVRYTVESIPIINGWMSYMCLVAGLTQFAGGSKAKACFHLGCCFSYGMCIFAFINMEFNFSVCLKMETFELWWSAIGMSDVAGILYKKWENVICKIWRQTYWFCKLDSGSLGCDGASFGEWFLMFRRIVMPSSSRLKQLSDCLTFEAECTVIFQNVGNTLPNNTASCCRKPAPSRQHGY